MYKKNLVSIVMPCYNGEKYIRDALEALLNQTYKNIELIIVNDESTDNSEKIIDEYAEKFKKNNMTLIKINQKNQGLGGAVNTGIKYINGEFFIWQDPDDYYELDAIENMYNYLICHTDVQFARGEANYRKEEKMDEILYHAKSKFPDNTNVFDAYVFETDTYCMVSTCMFRMEYFDKCVKNREIYPSRAGQDWQLILPMAYKGKCGYLNKVIFNCRLRDDSHSHSVKKLKDLLKRCDDHQDILFHVFDSISDMPEQTRKKYKQRVRIKYLKKKVRIVLSKIKHLGR